AAHAAPQVTDAAEDHHDHERARLHPVKNIGIDVLAVAREQRARESAGGAGDDEAHELVAVYRQAERLDARLVLADRDHHAAETRMNQAMQPVETCEQKKQDDVIENE